MNHQIASTPFKVDNLDVTIHPDRKAAGTAAAASAAHFIKLAILRNGSARVIVASAPSQDEVIAGIAGDPSIDWSRVTVFHMDEYCGLAAEHPASFRNYQTTHLLASVTPGAFHGIRGEARDLEQECSRYAALLAEKPIDLVCMGIGENGHIAFNDPPVADFADPALVKIVSLDLTCLQQQVNDGCFAQLDDVPSRAITLTCPALLSAKAIVCTVPGLRKASAVQGALNGPISTSCPASILRRHPLAELHLDSDSANFLSEIR